MLGAGLLPLPLLLLGLLDGDEELDLDRSELLERRGEMMHRTFDALGRERAQSVYPYVDMDAPGNMYATC